MHIKHHHVGTVMLGYLCRKYASHNSDSDISTDSNHKHEHSIDANYVSEQEFEETNLEESHKVDHNQPIKARLQGQSEEDPVYEDDHNDQDPK
jgi:hypothetical protein